MTDALALTWRQYRLERKMFWRNPSAAFFNFVLPLLFLAGGGAILAGNQHQLNRLIPAIAAMSVMSTTFTALAYNIVFLRERGVLKRIRGTPLPEGSYLLGVFGNAVANAIIQLALVIVAGKLLFGSDGLGYVDAPVLGTKKPAEEGQLVVLASSDGTQRELLEPFFDAVGKRTIWLGAAGEGSRLKVVVNAWLCSIAEGTAEMLRLAAALGLEPALVLDALEDGPLEAPYMRMKGEAMLRRDFSPSFKLWLATKDARLAADAGAAAGAEIPVIKAIAAQMEAVAAKHPDEDVAALFLGTGGS